MILKYFENIYKKLFIFYFSVETWWAVEEQEFPTTDVSEAEKLESQLTPEQKDKIARLEEFKSELDKITSSEQIVSWRLNTLRKGLEREWDINDPEYQDILDAMDRLNLELDNFSWVKDEVIAEIKDYMKKVWLTEWSNEWDKLLDKLLTKMFWGLFWEKGWEWSSWSLEGDIDINDLPWWVKWLLDFISIAEWTNNNYNAIYWDWWQNSIKFTEMTVQEVMEYQRTHAKNTWSSAIWKYQVLEKTLKGIVDNNSDISTSDKFTPELQDKIAIKLLEWRWLNSFLSWSMSTENFMKNISAEWASLPKDSSWAWTYDWDSMWNKARVWPSQLVAVLERAKGSVA